VKNLPKQNPYRKPLLKAMSEAYPTGKMAATRLDVSESLISRAQSCSKDPLQEVKYPSGVTRPHSNTTGKLGEFYGAISEIIPVNSSFKRKTTMTIDHLYADTTKALASQAPPGWKPLNPEYFRQLVHEMDIKIECNPQLCQYHWMWEKNGNGLGLDKTLYDKCCEHFRIYHRQQQAFFNFKKELIEGNFGLKMFRKSHSGHLLVVDFVQLDPSSSRYKDCVIHVYSKPTEGLKSLVSNAYHYIGAEAPLQPNNSSFLIEALTNLLKMDSFRDDSLVILFCDNGPKEFNCTFFCSLPYLEQQVNRNATIKKRIVVNNFAENHGGGPCDADGNIVEKELEKTQRNELVIMDDSSKFFPVINQMHGQTALDASKFQRDPQLRPAKFQGINSLYCFMIEEETGEVIGYSDSWILGDKTYISNPSKNKGKRQRENESKLRAGSVMNECEKCHQLYKKNHNCCKKAKTTEEVAGIEETESLGEGSVVPDDSEIPIKSRLKVWYPKKQKEYVGTVIDYEGENKYVMDWDDGRCKKNEVVELLLENRTCDPANDDRWDFV
jgi:hypothetical protein